MLRVFLHRHAENGDLRSFPTRRSSDLGSTGCVAVSESDPQVIYLGTGSDDVRSNVSTGRGMYKSTDGGATWKFIGLRSEEHTSELQSRGHLVCRLLLEKKKNRSDTSCH